MSEDKERLIDIVKSKDIIGLDRYSSPYIYYGYDGRIDAIKELNTINVKEDVLEVCDYMINEWNEFKKEILSKGTDEMFKDSIDWYLDEEIE